MIHKYTVLIVNGFNYLLFELQFDSKLANTQATASSLYFLFAIFFQNKAMAIIARFSALFNTSLFWGTSLTSKNYALSWN